MKPIKRAVFVTALGVIVAAAALTASWMTGDVGASPQEATAVPESTAEEPLPDFQPTERLPADSAVAFPTDI